MPSQGSFRSLPLGAGWAYRCHAVSRQMSAPSTTGELSTIVRETVRESQLMHRDVVVREVRKVTRDEVRPSKVGEQWQGARATRNGPVLRETSRTWAIPCGGLTAARTVSKSVTPWLRSIKVAMGYTAAGLGVATVAEKHQAVYRDVDHGARDNDCFDRVLANVAKGASTTMLRELYPEGKEIPVEGALICLLEHGVEPSILVTNNGAPDVVLTLCEHPTRPLVHLKGRHYLQVCDWTQDTADLKRRMASDENRTEFTVTTYANRCDVGKGAQYFYNQLRAVPSSELVEKVKMLKVAPPTAENVQKAISYAKAARGTHLQDEADRVKSQVSPQPAVQTSTAAGKGLNRISRCRCTECSVRRAARECAQKLDAEGMQRTAAHIRECANSSGSTIADVVDLIRCAVGEHQTAMGVHYPITAAQPILVEGSTAGTSGFLRYAKYEEPGFTKQDMRRCIRVHNALARCHNIIWIEQDCQGDLVHGHQGPGGHNSAELDGICACCPGHQWTTGTAEKLSTLAHATRRGTQHISAWVSKLFTLEDASSCHKELAAAGRVCRLGPKCGAFQLATEVRRLGNSEHRAPVLLLEYCTPAECAGDAAAIKVGPGGGSVLPLRLPRQDSAKVLTYFDCGSSGVIGDGDCMLHSAHARGKCGSAHPVGEWQQGTGPHTAEGDTISSLFCQDLGHGAKPQVRDRVVLRKCTICARRRAYIRGRQVAHNDALSVRGHGPVQTGIGGNVQPREPRSLNMAGAPAHPPGVDVAVVVADGCRPPQVTPTPVGDGEGNLQSIGGQGPKANKRRRKNKGATISNKPPAGPLPRECEAPNAKIEVAAPVLGCGDTSGMHTQRDTVMQESGDSGYSPARCGLGKGGGLDDDEGHAIRTGVCASVCWTGGTRPGFSSTAAGAVSGGSFKTSGRTVITANSDCQGVRQERKVEDKGKGWRPTNDTGEKSGVQPLSGHVHQGDRTCAVPPAGPRVPGLERRANDSQGTQPQGKGKGSKGAMGVNGRPRGDKLGSQQVGHARDEGADAGGNASSIPHVHQRPLDGLAAELPAQQQVLDGERLEVHKSSWGYEWGYDDRTWQLYCRRCDRNEVPSDAVRRCYEARQERSANSARRTRASDPINSPGLPVLPTVPERAPQDLRRWGRPRADNGAPVLHVVGENTACLLGDGRPRVKGRRVYRPVSSNTVLPDQAFLRGLRVDNDPRPLQGDSNLDGGDWTTISKSRKVPRDGVARTKFAPRRDTTGRRVLHKELVDEKTDDQSQGAAKGRPGDISDAQRARRRTKANRYRRNRRARDAVAREETSLAGANTRAAPNVQPTVGNKPGNAKGMGANYRDDPKRFGVVANRAPPKVAIGLSSVAALDMVFGKPKVAKQTVSHVGRMLDVEAVSLVDTKEARTAQIALEALFDPSHRVNKYGNVHVVETTDSTLLMRTPVNGDIIAHSVGADMSMGKGVAKQIQRVFGRPRGRGALGHVEWLDAKGARIANMVTKVRSSIPGHESSSYMKHLRDAMRDVYVRAKREHVKVYMPYLVGCGLDGMNEGDCKDLIQGLAKEYDVPTIVVKLADRSGGPIRYDEPVK